MRKGNGGAGASRGAARGDLEDAALKATALTFYIFTVSSRPAAVCKRRFSGIQSPVNACFRQTNAACMPVSRPRKNHGGLPPKSEHICDALSTSHLLDVRRKRTHIVRRF